MIQLTAAALAFYVVSQGADPLTAFALFTAILIGPDAVETLVANADQTDSE